MVGQIYDVESGIGYIRIEYPDKAYTKGVGPCFAVGILNRALRVGYLGHFLTGSMVEVKSFEEMLNQAKSEAGRLSHLEMALAGTVPSTIDDILLTRKAGVAVEFRDILAELLKYREIIRGVVKSSGVPRHKVMDFLENGPSECDYSITVDTERGKIIVEKED